MIRPVLKIVFSLSALLVNFCFASKINLHYAHHQSSSLPQGQQQFYIDVALAAGNFQYNIAYQQLNPESFYLLTHGRPGELFINGEWLNAKAVAGFLKNNNLIAATARQLKIFGCEFAKGAEGIRAVQELAGLLGISVAASTNITGIDGDWILEIGNVDETKNFKTYCGNLQCSGVVGGTGPGDDFDGDGICNNKDIDDDNDGVLDYVEGACPNGLNAGTPFTALSQIKGVSSGRYFFNFENGIFLADVDNSEGGGWLLVLQYIHKGGTNPELKILKAGDNFPVTSLAVLGADEKDSTTKWGHAGNAALSQFSEDFEIRFFGETSTHTKKIHFSTTLGASYAKTGAGSFTDINSASNHTNLTGHTATIPLNVDNNFMNQADLALTNFPYYDHGTAHWGIKAGSRSPPDRWEVDNFPDKPSENTIHRVWIRAKMAATSCTPTDTDDDKIPNYLDLDSDGDGCSDLVESGVLDTLRAKNGVTSSKQSVAGSGVPADYGVNGFYSKIETNDSIYAKYAGGIYTYNLAVDKNIDRCRDTDGDGISDYVDLDDDRDGILDALESPGCFYSRQEIAVPQSVTTEVTPTGTIANTFDNNTATTFVFTKESDYNGKEIFEITPKNAVALSSILLRLNNATNPFDAASKALKVQGYDGASWVDLTLPSPLSTVPAVTANLVTFKIDTNIAAYLKYRIQGVATGKVLVGGVIQEIILEPRANYNASAYPKSSCSDNADGAEGPNHQDLDSDGDGCYDAYEAGVPGSTKATSNFTDSILINPATPTAGVGANGYKDSLETLPDSGRPNFAGKYYIAASKQLNACSDSDNDGVGDLADLDDDNDGVLDYIEGACPNGFSAGTPFTALSQIKGVSSGRYFFNLGKGIFQADVDNSEGGGWLLVLQYIHKGGTNPDLKVVKAGNNFPITSAAALGADEKDSTTKWGHAGNAALSQFSEDFETRFFGETSDHTRKIHFSTTLGASYVKTGKGSFTGINNVSNHTNLTGHTAILPFNVNATFSDQDDNALTNFPYYKENSAHWGIKGNTDRWEVDDQGQPINTIHRVWIRAKTAATPCTPADTDDDKIPNYLDLDSDGDGCSDLVESGVLDTLLAKGGIISLNQSVAGTGAPVDYGANGFYHKIESNDSSNAKYIGTYTYNLASDKNVNNCSNTDNDSIPDYIDLDDDNDGVLDNIEACNFTQYQKPGRKITGTNNTIQSSTLNTSTLSASTSINCSSVIIDNQYRISNPRDSCDFIAKSGTSKDHIWTLKFTNPIEAEDISFNLNGSENTAPTPKLAFKINFAADSSFGTARDVDFTNIITQENLKRVDDTTFTATAASYLLRIKGYGKRTVKSITLHQTNSEGARNLFMSILVQSDTCDKDKDGINNELDLDSDGDGCPDAVEAGTYNKSGVTTSSGSQGVVANTPNAIINGPYSNNGFADVLQKAVPDTNQYRHTYTYANAIDSTTIVCCLAGDTMPVFSVTTAEICAGSSFNLNSVVTSKTPKGAELRWHTDSLHATRFNTPAEATAGKYFAFYHDTARNCFSPSSVAFTITEKPLPTGSATPASQAICSGESSLIALNSTVAGTTFSWSATGTASGFSSCTSNCGTKISQVLSNSGNVDSTVAYVVTPSANGCAGAPFNVEVTVKPKPFGTATPSTQSICSGSSTDIQLTSPVAGTTFSWGATGTASGFSSCTSGCGSRIAQVLNNSGNIDSTVTYVVTPSPANGCAGAPFNVEVTVKPKPFGTATPSTQSICSGSSTDIQLTSPVAGTTFSWSATGTASGFSSCTSGCGSRISQVLNNSGNIDSTVTYVVTPSANGCAGAPFNVEVTVKPIPVGTATPSTQSICSGSSTDIQLASTISGTTFSWSATGTASGFSSCTSGCGSRIAQVLNNSGNIDSTVTYVVTPSANGCAGAPFNVEVTVKPIPFGTATPSTQSICSGSSTDIQLASTISGTTFSWSATGTASGFSSCTSGCGSRISQVLNNSGNIDSTVTYVVTPSVNGCAGAPFNVGVTVKPIPVGTATPSTQSICSGQRSSVVLQSTIAGTTYTWTASQPSGISTGQASGSGDTIAQKLTNTGSGDAVVRYTVTPTDEKACSGRPFTIDVTVKPKIAISFTSMDTICLEAAPMTLTATPVGGTWSGKGVTESAFNPKTAGLRSHVIKYKVTVDGCIDSATTRIKVIDCADADNDFITNQHDIDDDNDGILDEVESLCDTINTTRINLTERRSTGFYEADNWFDRYGFYMYEAATTAPFSPVDRVEVISHSGDTDGKYISPTPNFLSIDFFGPNGSKNEVNRIAIFADPDTSNFKGTIQVIALDKNDAIIYSESGLTDAKEYVVDESKTGGKKIHRILIRNEILNSAAFEMLSFSPSPVNCADRDTDGDGIANRIDLDSDGDGCPDAKEAGPGTKPEIATSSGDVKNGSGGMVTSTVSTPGAVINGPYGGNGFADALQKASPADTNQYNDTYRYYIATNNIANSCEDSDKDNIPNFLDIDNDNDGVLDYVEGACPNGLTQAAPFTALSQVKGVPSGRYFFNLGDGVFQADVDNSEGGGWLLVLQYIHKEGTNPDLKILKVGDNFPITSIASLGADQSNSTTKWGNAGNAALSRFSEDFEIRFFGESSDHTRKIHFYTTLGTSYLKTGIGSFEGISNTSNFTGLTGHTANIPLNVDKGFTDKGDNALTNFPFYKGSAAHWAIQGDGNRWEVDNYPSNANNNTIHKVWIRAATTPAPCMPTNSDGDSKPNYLDADSDNDGCSDLVESGVLDTLLAKGGIISSNQSVAGTGAPVDYGANGFYNKIESNDSSLAKYIGTYTYNLASDKNVNNCSNSDNDSIPDYIDLDDDNDGVLDNVEACNFTQYQKSGRKITGTNNTIQSSTLNTSTLSASTSTNCSPTIIDNQYRESNPRDSCDFIAKSGTSKDHIWTLRFTNAIEAEDIIFNINGGGNTTSTSKLAFKINFGADSSLGTAREVDFTNVITQENIKRVDDTTFTATAAPYLLRIKGYGKRTVKSITLHQVNSDSTGSLSMSILVQSDTCDKDKDSINNELDLDSDGDGCPDAVEAGTYNKSGVTTSSGSQGVVANTPNAIINGPYSNNGFVDVLQKAAPDSNSYNDTYTYDEALDSTVIACCAAGKNAPVLNDVDTVICSGSTFNLDSVVSSTTPSEAVLEWYSDRSHTMQYNTPTAATEGRYFAFYHDTVRNCFSPSSVAFTITEKPLPTGSATPASQAICSGESSSIALNSTMDGTTFSWTVTGPTTTSGFSNGSGNTISQTLTNNETSPADVTYVVTPSANGCAGAPFNVEVTVNPIPEGSSSGNAPICSESTTNILLSSTTAGASFSWTVTGSTTTDGFSNGSDNTISQTLTNSGISPAEVTYVVTPSANDCTGTPYNVVVTVNPLPVASISYPGSPYITQGTASVTQTGQAGGTYSSTTGLMINSQTGTINLTASKIGDYKVKYVFGDANNCMDSAFGTLRVNPSVDTVRITPSCPTCPVTVCAVQDDLDTAGGSYTLSARCNNISADYGSSAITAAGCITYTPDGMVTDTVETCIVTCKNGFCDTTRVILYPPVPKPDTVITRSACPTCPVTVCAVVNDVDTTGPTGYSTPCGIPANYFVGTVNDRGCITYIPNGMVASDDTVCIVTCDTAGTRCDTTLIILRKPISPDTVTVKPSCPTCATEICVVSDDIDKNSTTAYSSCGLSPADSTKGSLRLNVIKGCMVWKGNKNNVPPVDTINSCIVACSNGECDTTYVRIVPPQPPYGPDTVVVGTQAPDISTVPQCPTSDDIPKSYENRSKKYCGLSAADSLKGSLTRDNSGCIIWEPNNTQLDTVKTCVIECGFREVSEVMDTVCDTTYFYFVPPPVKDTQTVIFKCGICPVTICATADDIEVTNSSTFSTCAIPVGYIVQSGPNVKGCYVLTADQSNIPKDTLLTCVIACDGNICDTTVVRIIPPPQSDTLYVRASCPDCDTVICPAVNDVAAVSYSICDTAGLSALGYSVVQDAVTGCVTYRPNGEVTDTISACIISCDGANRCDTTRVILVPPVPVTDTLYVRPSCPSCPVVACIVKNDVDSVGARYSQPCGVPENYTVVLDSLRGCVTYTPNGRVTRADTVCIKMCDSLGRCDSTIVILPAPPSKSDTVRITPPCPSCPVEACIVKNDVDSVGARYSQPCGVPENYTVVLDSLRGCVTYTPNGRVTRTDTVCIRMCDSLGRCDSTIVILSAPPSKSDTVRITPPCPSCPVEACIVKNDVDSVGAIYSQPCGVPENYTVVLDSLRGCVTYTPNGRVTRADTVCIKMCDSLGRCDSTIVILSAPPSKSDTVRITPPCPSCPVEACIVKNDVDSVGARYSQPCGVPENYTVVLDSLRGCVTYTPNGRVTRTDTVCIRMCDSLGRCDSTIVILSAPPSKSDTVRITPPCPSCPVEACIVKNDVDSVGARYSQPCGVPENYTVVLDSLRGCVTYTPNGRVTRADTVCIKMCDSLGRCDSTIVILSAPPSKSDTVRITPPCPSCPVEACIVKNDVDSVGARYSQPCGVPESYTVVLDSLRGCVTYTPNGRVTRTDTVCIKMCDSLGRCDSTIVILPAPPSKSDTVRITPPCPSCPVEACIVKNDVDSVGARYSQPCGVPENYTVVLDSLRGCVTYTPNGRVTRTDTVCIRMCDSLGRCDSTIVILSAPPSKSDTVRITPPCPSCPVEACIVKNDVDSVGARYSQPCGVPENYTVVLDSLRGCVTYTPNGRVTRADTVCIKMCDSLGRCDSTIIFISVPDPFLEVDCPDSMLVCLNGGPISLSRLNHNPKGGIWTGTGVSDDVFNPKLAGIGKHKIEYNYRDTITGGRGFCSFIIEVGDTTTPVVVKCADVKTVTIKEGCNGIVPDFTRDVAATDNCSAADSLIITQAPAAGSTVNLGDTVVTIRIADGQGNYTECKTKLVIIDTILPLLACTGDMNLDANYNGCRAKVFIPNIVFVDNCRVSDVYWRMSGATVDSSSKLGINLFENAMILNGGTTVVTYFVVDRSGNVDSCSFRVRVNVHIVKAQSTSTIACYNSTGILTVESRGGYMPYEYSAGGAGFQYSNKFAAAEGIYNIMVKDSIGCMGDTVHTVEGNGEITATSISVDEDCVDNPGHILVKPNGGTPDYTFKLGDGEYQADSIFSNLRGGSYVIFIQDSKGCVASINATVQSSSSVNVVKFEAVSTHVICKGSSSGSAELTAEFSGGKGELTQSYRWFNELDPGRTISYDKNLTNAAAGVYIVEVKVQDSKSPCVSFYQTKVEIREGLNSITARISGSTTVEQASTPFPQVIFNASGGLSPYSYTYTMNGGSEITVQGSPSSTTPQSTEDVGEFVYKLLKVEDASGCEIAVDSFNTAVVTVTAKHGPDITPLITILPAIAHGVTKHMGYVLIQELNGYATRGTITVFMTKDSKVELEYNPTETQLQGIFEVDNREWIFDDSGFSFYKFTTNSVIPAMGNLKFGFLFTFNVGESIGNLQLTSSILYPSGGENEVSNNVDTDVINYFIN